MRGYDPYEEALLKQQFKNSLGYAAPGTNDAFYDPKDADWYASSTKSTATVIPGFGNDEADDDEQFDVDADLTIAGNTGPAPLTDIPTSSSNSARPRTVAAGYQAYAGAGAVPYEARRGKLTVMFRDGTLYNYYDVSPEEWILFKGQLSKGHMLNWHPVPGFLLKKDHGPADLSQVSAKTQATIQRVARAAQVRFANKRPAAAAMGMGGTRTVRNSVPKNAASRARLSHRVKGYGVNPNANRGKNPN